MKKILLTAIVALFAVTAASAQDKGNWALGPRMNIYTNTGDAVVGLGAFGRYSFTDNWRIEPSLMALLHSGCSIDISVDAQYVFHLGEGWSVVGVEAGDVFTIGQFDAKFILKYDGTLAAGADTTAMFQTVTIPAGLDNASAASFDEVKVVAQAIQADGFDTWEAAFTAFDAK